jgi:hypothetical protein
MALIIVLIGVVFFVTFKIINQVSHHDRRAFDIFMFVFAMVGMLSHLCASSMIQFSNNPARRNYDAYDWGYLFLESGFRKNDIERKLYPWDNFASFEADPQIQAINLKLRSGDQLNLKIQQEDFDLQLPALELFLRKKIAVSPKTTL